MGNPISEFINDQYQNGITEFNAVLKNGETMKLRLFIGSHSGMLCYVAKGKQKRGYPLYDLIPDIESVKVANKKANKTQYEDFISDLKKFKKIYTTKLHKNLWSEIRDCYNRLDIEDFENFVENKGLSHYDLYQKLHEYSKIHDLSHLVFENHYKLANVSNPYYSERIKNHLENKEDFHYYWRTSYDISVSGKLCDDGIYRAWYSAEYKDCGNGHYYLLINENQAVFAEDD